MRRYSPEKLAADSITRRLLLETIAAKGPAPATVLEGDVDLSVSTINRVVNRFERENLLERTSEGIVLTAAGEVLLSEIERFVGVVETTRHLEPLLTALTHAPIEFESDWIHLTNVTRATPSNPYAPLSRYSELFSEATEKRLVGDQFVIPEQGVKTAMREIGESVHCACVWSEQAVDRMAEQFPDMIEWSLDRENLTARVAESVSLDLALFDNHLLVYGFDERNVITVLIDSDNPEIVQWGETVFEALFEQAESVSI